MTPSHGNAWDAALYVLERLRAQGHVALLAGGCVRDRLLNLEPKDYDVATDATPPRVAELFPHSRKVGAKFGVMLVRRFGHDIEVATFRSDGTYSDGRHPDEVTFGSEIEDARRRDFTINGLFLDPTDDRVIDHVGGQADLTAGIVRTIGGPDRRFAEDHLRLLRAVRFASRLGFAIEVDTFSAIQRHGPHLEAISAERVWTELEAILTAPSRARGWELLRSTGLRNYLSKPWNPNADEDDAVQRRIALLANRPIPPTLALAAVLCAREVANISHICQELRLSNQLRKAVLWLVQALPGLHHEPSLELADLKLLLANPNWDQLLELLRVELESTGEKGDLYDRVSGRAMEVDPKSVAPRPLVTGEDLTKLGLAPGPKLGELLAIVYRAQLNENISTREQALTLAKEQIQSL